MSEESLPSLREDLNLFEGPPLRNGAPTWTLHDPLRNRYFRIGWIEFELLSRFRLGSVDALLQEVNRIGLVEVTEQRLQQLIRFLRENRLAGSPQPADGGGREYSLFYFKIPLLHPDRMLGNMSRFVGFLFSPFFLLGVLSLGILSILMLFQQWEQFLHTFTAFQSPLGVAAFAVAILFSKLIHELGHGLTAEWYGLRVPTFGVVFMFFWPVLYTDTSDAWRLRSRNARLWIGSAGVIAETILAIIASFCWLWLPEGLPKAIAFTIAVTTWGMTFLVNLNPFMRFDGYFLLSDAWDIPNLQARAFELGRGYLRAWLFGLPTSLPLPGESKSGSVWLIGYAYLTWVYRLLVYVALAAAAYLLLFKVLGIVLLVVEMAVLVVKPVVSELRGSWALRGQFRWRWSNRLLVALLLVGVGCLMVPWKS